MKKSRAKHSPRKPAIEINPNINYTAAECLQILRCSQPTLVRLRRDRGFPLKMIGKGIALGSDILAWQQQQADRPVVERPRRKLAAK